MANTKKEAPLKSTWGSVRIYVRHIDGCKRKGDANKVCKCSWWLYCNNHKGRVVSRRSLTTPSRAEALKLATYELTGFDPEIAAARAKDAEVKRISKTPLEAVNFWLDRTAASYGTGSIHKQYRSTFGWVDKDGVTHGAFLEFLERYNQKHRDVSVSTVQDITPEMLQEWHNGWNLSTTTKHQRWGTVRSFFNYLFQLGVLTRNPAIAIKAVPNKGEFRNVPFSDSQYEMILKHAGVYVDDRVKNGESEVYCQRMVAYLECLRWTGMDLMDAVKLCPSTQIDQRGVLTYTRTKTRITAKIPLEARIVEMLRGVPSIPGGEPDTPFRYRNNLITSDVHNWSRRIKKLFQLAKIDKVSFRLKDGSLVEKKPNAKSFRHTFAVDCVSRLRLRVEVVARMLGHVDATMVQRHYAPWTTERDDMLAEEVWEARQARRQREMLATPRMGRLQAGEVKQ
jgi:integrase